MDKLLIKGGTKLSGSLEVTTAKNAVLPILAGCILCDSNITLKKFPFYDDTLNMLHIIEDLGAKTQINSDEVFIDASTISKTEINSNLASKLRSSIFSLGAILGRFKKAKVAHPGGCAIGARPIDLHIKGLQALGVKIIDKHGYLNCDGSNMTGGMVHLDFPSVGATENIMMAAVLTKGVTKIFNPAKEPEIANLADFLNSMGARIYGAGTNIIEIHGVNSLKSTCFTPMSDRIITGTYLIAAAMCGGDIELTNTRPDYLESLLSMLKNNGCKVRVKYDKINIVSDKRIKAISKIQTMPYPGFPTDLQAQTMAMLTVSKGTSIMVENLFESRFKHVPELIKMGADITVNDRTCVIKGVNVLYGAEVTSTDLRGGAALVLAGLVAQGYTKVGNVHHIDRGYQHIEKDLQNLGANIERVT